MVLAPNKSNDFYSLFIVLPICVALFSCFCFLFVSTFSLSPFAPFYYVCLIVFPFPSFHWSFPHFYLFPHFPLFPFPVSPFSFFSYSFVPVVSFFCSPVSFFMFSTPFPLLSPFPMPPFVPFSFLPCSHFSRCPFSSCSLFPWPLFQATVFPMWHVSGVSSQSEHFGAFETLATELPRSAKASETPKPLM